MNAGEVASGNLFAGLTAAEDGEDFRTLLSGAGFRLVRIVSTGQATPAGEWYDQDDDEWVALLRGRAGLLIEGEAVARQLEAGDWALLPAHVRHRVEWTDPDGATVWLALHHGG